MEIVRDWLAENNKIVYLSLRDNQITDAGVKSLVVGLKKNNTLKVIKLNKNKIGDEGAKLLIEAIKEKEDFGQITGKKVYSSFKSNQISEKLLKELNGLCDMKQTQKDIEESMSNITGKCSQLSLNSSALLKHDCTSEEENEILGASFNIPYDKNQKPIKFVPGNKIHKELAANTKLFRTKFYESRKEDNHKNTKEQFAEWYKKQEGTVLKIESDLQKSKNNDKKEKFFKNYKDFKEKVSLFDEKCSTEAYYQELKNNKKYKEWKETIEKKIDFISSPFLKSVEIKDSSEKIESYPNFATAKLSYINKAGRIESKFLNAPSESEKEKISGHSEVQIFRVAKDIIESDKVSGENTIILDIHTTLSMCGGCCNEAKKFIQEHTNVKIRVSYCFPFGNTIYNDDNIVQKKITIEKGNENLKEDNIVFISSSYLSSPIKKNIDKVKKSLSPKKNLDQKHQIKNKAVNSKAKKKLNFSETEVNSLTDAVYDNTLLNYPDKLKKFFNKYGSTMTSKLIDLTAKLSVCSSDLLEEICNSDTSTETLALLIGIDSSMAEYNV